MKKLIQLLFQSFCSAVFKKIFEKILMSSSIISLATSAKLFLNLIENLLKNNMQLTISLLSAGWALAIFFSIQFLMSNQKKLINGIIVNKKGLCFCPACNSHLEMHDRPRYSAQKLFYCKLCKENKYSLLQNGQIICAQYFSSQQYHAPQTLITHDYVMNHKNSRTTPVPD